MKKVVVKKVARTDGQGVWSSKQKAVRINAIDLAHVDKEHGYGELRVYFNPADWNISHYGLIYTDNAFIREVRIFLKEIGLTGVRGMKYSEHGMQGWNFVSFNVGSRFVTSYNQKF